MQLLFNITSWRCCASVAETSHALLIRLVGIVATLRVGRHIRLLATGTDPFSAPRSADQLIDLSNLIPNEHCWIFSGRELPLHYITTNLGTKRKVGPPLPLTSPWHDIVTCRPTAK
jgi:hypothetical protein